MMTLHGVLAFIPALITLGCASTTTLSSVPPSAWPRKTQREEIRPLATDSLATRTIAFDVALPMSVFVRAFLYQGELSEFVPGTGTIPGVHHTEPLTALPYPEVGSVRLVCLEDGNSAEEEVLEQDEKHLRYLVSNYTSPDVKPVAYGLGEFRFSPTEVGTHIVWSYSFKLRSDQFPGSWKALGRTLFRLRFLNADYADFMESVKGAIQSFALRLASQKKMP
jgi:hypothetical protein